MKAVLTFLLLVSLSLARYPNQLDPYDVQFVITTFNDQIPSAGPPPTVGNFTFDIIYPARLSWGRKYVGNPLTDTYEFMFFHCFFDEEETQGVQLEVKRNFTTP